eukprot:Skav201340  [mRNA]  locus=scaffold1389:285692:294035:+ [translate_table: standard]
MGTSDHQVFRRYSSLNAPCRHWPLSAGVMDVGVTFRSRLPQAASSRPRAGAISQLGIRQCKLHSRWVPTCFSFFLYRTFTRGLGRTLRKADELGYGREDLGEGGSDADGKYTWTRNGMEVVVAAEVGPDTSKKDISASFGMRQVAVAVEGKVLFEGIPGCELEVDDCFWEIDEDSSMGSARRRDQAPQDADAAMGSEDTAMGPAELAEDDEDVAFEALLEKRVHQDYDKDSMGPAWQTLAMTLIWTMCSEAA